LLKSGNLASLGFLCFLIGRFNGSAILKRDEGDVAAHLGATPLLPNEIKNLFAQAGN